MDRFLLGCAMTAVSLPTLTIRLWRSGSRHDMQPGGAAAGGTTVTNLRLPGQPAASPAAAPAGQIRPPDPLPEVTPAAAKAGGVRRTEQPPPCHDCRCCKAYATRVEAAHREIDRLRDEINRADARRINQTVREG